MNHKTSLTIQANGKLVIHPLLLIIPDKNCFSLRACLTCVDKIMIKDLFPFFYFFFGGIRNQILFENFTHTLKSFWCMKVLIKAFFNNAVLPYTILRFLGAEYSTFSSSKMEINISKKQKEGKKKGAFWRVFIYVHE